MTFLLWIVVLLILGPIWILAGLLILHILWLVIVGSWLGLIGLVFGEKED